MARLTYCKYPVLLFFAAFCVLLLPFVNALAQGATPPPPPTRTPLPSLTPSPTTVFGIATGAPGTPAPLPTSLPSPTAPAALELSPTSPLLAFTPTALTEVSATPPAVQPGKAPPLKIKLPQGWKYGYQIVPIQAALVESSMNLAVYVGPVPNGVGTILVLWGFPSIGSPNVGTTPGSGASATPGPNPIVMQMLYADGLRMLQGTVLDITCNVGTSDQRAFTVGGVSGTGTYFNVSQCQGEADTAGWFVGVNDHGRSFLFYMYVEPIEAYNDARGDLQRILDTVTFDLPAPTPTVTATPAP